MRYIYRPAREVAESTYLAGAFDKHWHPVGSLSLSDSVIMDTRGVSLVELNDECLAIHGDSASWAFLTREELSVYSQLDGLHFGELGRRLNSRDAALDLAANLWRRGLIGLNGEYAVPPDLFADGPNYKEGHLVELLLTEKCNLACPYCLAGAHQKMPAMDEPLAMRVIDLAFAMDEAETIAFEFAGGEPFLKFRLMKKLVNYINTHKAKNNRRLFLSIQTNGTLLTAERVQWIKDNDIRVGISLDGGAQAQNRSRPQVNGKASHSQLMAGIKLLQQHQVSFGGLVVLNRSNIADPAALASFMVEHGIHGFRINPVAYLGDARKNWETVGLEQEEIIQFMQQFITHVVDKKLLILEDNIHSMCNFLTSKQRRTRCMRSHCGAGDTFQSVAANGDIYPCGRATQSPGLKLGNVFDDLTSLSQPAQKSIPIKVLRERRPHQFSDCASCHYRQLCQSGCSVQAWERFQTISHKTPECLFYKTLYPWLMRWLCFDSEAFSHLERCKYFEGEGMLFNRPLVPIATLEQSLNPVIVPRQHLSPKPLTVRAQKNGITDQSVTTHPVAPPKSRRKLTASDAPIASTFPSSGH